MIQRGSGKTRDEDFARVYNDVKTYPALKDVADHFSCSVKSVRRHAVRIRKRARSDKSTPRLINRVELKTPPRPSSMSERELRRLRRLMRS